jgi:predicted DNA-binding ribbon-helix-helix protein
MCSAIDCERQRGNLSSAVRLFVLNFYRQQLGDHEMGTDGRKFER